MAEICSGVALREIAAEIPVLIGSTHALAPGTSAGQKFF